MSKKEPPAPVFPPVYLTVKEASRYLGCTISAIRHELVYAKAVPYVRLGKRIVFSRADLDAFMLAKKAAA